MRTVQPELADEEARRAAQHEAIKGGVVDDVNRDVADRAASPASRSEVARMDRAAAELRGHAVDEVIDGEHHARKARGLARASQFVDYAFFLVYALLALRFFLAIIGANAAAGFARFIATVSDPFYAPFRNIVESPAVGAHGRVLLPAVIAMLAYGVLHLVVYKALRMAVSRRTEL
jgi:uncharacterized protein YggT (Ycf19 family)